MQLRLGLVHAVTLLGLVLGGFTASYFFGYRVGKSERFEQASSEALEKMPRIPIPEEEKPQKVPERLVSDVYAKLQDAEPPLAVEPSKESDETDLELKPVKIMPRSEEEPPATKPKKKEKTLADLEPTSVKKSVEEKTENESKLVTQDPQVVVAVKEAGEKKETSNTTEKTEVAKVVVQEPSSKKAATGFFELGNTQKKEISPVPPAEKAKTVQKVAVAPAPVPDSSGKLSSGWYVQLAAHETPNEAEALQKLLKDNGFLDARIQNATVDGKKYYRVLVGPEKTTLLAKRLRDQLKREPYVQFKPYLRRIQ